MKVVIPEVKNSITEESKIRYLKFYLAVPSDTHNRETALFMRMYSPIHTLSDKRDKCVLFSIKGYVYHSDVEGMLANYTIYEVDNSKITLTLGQ